MTSRASSLTERVNAPAPQADYKWSLPANGFRAFLNAFACLGHDAEGLLASAGITVADSNDPDARVPCEHLDKIISSAQHQRFTPNLAIELARVTPFGRIR